MFSIQTCMHMRILCTLINHCAQVLLQFTEQNFSDIPSLLFLFVSCRKRLLKQTNCSILLISVLDQVDSLSMCSTEQNGMQKDLDSL